MWTDKVGSACSTAGLAFTVSYRGWPKVECSLPAMETLLRDVGGADSKGLIAALGRKKRWQEALAVLHGLGDEADLLCRNAALGACARAVQWQRALALHAEEDQRDTVTYNSAMNACVGDWQICVALLRGLQQSHLQPDRISYSAGISACGSKAAWEQALLLLEELGERRLEADLICCNASISACAKGQQWQKAICLLSDVDFGPDIISYNSVLDALGRGDEWEKALLQFWTLPSDLRANLITFNAAITCCERGSRWRDALHLLEIFPSRGLLPDLISVNAAMSACQEVQEWERSLSLLNTLESRRLSPDLFTYATAIGSLSSRWPLAVELLEQLLDSGLRPNLVVCNALLATCAAEQADLALKIWRELRDWEPRGPSDAQNQVIACSSVLCAEVGWEMAFTLLEDARSLGLQLDVVCYGASCERQEKWQQASQLLNQVRDSLQTTSVLVNSAISLGASSRRSDWQGAFGLLPDARQEALEPDLVSFNATISVSGKAMRWQQALRLLEQGSELRIRHDVTTYGLAVTACDQAGAWEGSNFFGVMQQLATSGLQGART